MLEQGEQRHRRECLRRRGREREEQGAGRSLGKRPASAVVGLDAPALEMGRHAAGERAVGTGSLGRARF